MLDSPEGVYPGQVQVEYPATSVLFTSCAFCSLVALYVFVEAARLTW